MDEAESPSHTKWECKYHVVFIPKCRRKTLYQALGRHLGGSVPTVDRTAGSADLIRPRFVPDVLQKLRSFGSTAALRRKETPPPAAQDRHPLPSRLSQNWQNRDF
jgi:hypothetical protein